jgi:hypothetical protein
MLRCAAFICRPEIKEVKLRPVTEKADYDTKVKQAQKFLSKGAKVKLTMTFSGREMRFKDQGKEMMLVSTLGVAVGYGVVSDVLVVGLQHSGVWPVCSMLVYVIASTGMLVLASALS